MYFLWCVEKGPGNIEDNSELSLSKWRELEKAEIIKSAIYFFKAVFCGTPSIFFWKHNSYSTFKIGTQFIDHVVLACKLRSGIRLPTLVCLWVKTHGNSILLDCYQQIHDNGFSFPKRGLVLKVRDLHSHLTSSDHRWNLSISGFLILDGLSETGKYAGKEGRRTDRQASMTFNHERALSSCYRHMVKTFSFPRDHLEENLLIGCFNYPDRHRDNKTPNNPESVIYRGTR